MIDLNRMSQLSSGNIQQQMRHYRKLQMIKLYANRLRFVTIEKLMEAQQNQYASYFNGEQPHAPTVEQEQSPVEDQDDSLEAEQDDFSLTNYIDSLPNNLRQQFRRQNPQLPEIFFMTNQQKKKYFAEVNNSFKKNLSSMPQRRSKTKKILKFKNDFQVKPFNQNQKVTSIKHSKQFHETYQASIHFS